MFRNFLLADRLTNIFISHHITYEAALLYLTKKNLSLPVKTKKKTNITTTTTTTTETFTKIKTNNGFGPPLSVSHFKNLVL